MHRFCKYIFLMSTLLLVSSCCGAQTFSTNISATKIGLKQYVTVSYEVGNGNNIESFAPPKYNNWLVVAGPNNSSYTSSINGQVTKRTSITYMLQPQKTGKLVIDGSSIVVDGKKLESKPLVVEVVAQDVPNNGATAQTGSNPMSSLFDDPFFGEEPEPVPTTVDDALYIKSTDNLNKKINDVLALRVETSKNTCYEGEPITGTYKMYARVEVEVGFSKRPSFSGFSSVDIEEPSQNYNTETLNGKKYRVYTIRKVQLYPLQSGNLTLEPVELDCKMRFIKYEQATQPGFDPYDLNNYITTSYTLKSGATNIKVLPLPTIGKPADFNGAVGNFTIGATTNLSETGKDDATILKVTIAGSGNFSMVHAPLVKWPSTIEAYEPKEKENLTFTTVPITGEKTFDYVFLCHQPGTIELPTVAFSYFDIATKAYKTISTKPIVLNVAAQSKQPQRNLKNDDANFPLVFVAIAKYALPILAILLLTYLLISFLLRKKRKQAYSEQKEMDDAWQRMMDDDKKITPTINTSKVPLQHQKEDAATNDSNNSEHENYLPSTPKQTNSIVEEPIATPIPASTTSYSLLPNADAAKYMPTHTVFYEKLKSDIQHVLTTIAVKAEPNLQQLFNTLQLQGAEVQLLQQIKTILDECDAAIYAPVQPHITDRQNLLDEANYLLGILKK
jgi:hypothetical protein